MSKAKAQRCPECGGVMVHETRADSVAYRDATRPVRVLGWWCRACGEAILEGGALQARERAFATLKAEVEQVMGPAEVATVRGRLGLSQRKAGELLGGGPRAFQKYESGEQAVSVPMSRLLTLLANDPARLRELGGAEGSSRTKASAGRAVGTTRAGGRRRSG
jgi:HTH-type transcriptional regulator/antitoxin MqsA